jgi:hypothetical protein
VSDNQSLDQALSVVSFELGYFTLTESFVNIPNAELQTVLQAFFIELAHF